MFQEKIVKFKRSFLLITKVFFYYNNYLRFFYDLCFKNSKYSITFIYEQFFHLTVKFRYRTRIHFYYEYEKN